MSGLENIIQNIKEEAEQEKESILKKAKNEADTKKSETEEKAETEKERIIERGRREADRIKRRTIASARREARQKKLEAREELIQRALEDAEEELAELRDDNERYKEVLKDLIITGGIAVGGGDLEVSVLRNDKKLISEKEIGEMTEKIFKETGNETELEVLANLQNADGGTIVQKSDGSITCNNTFKSKLQRMKSSLRPKISGILFEE